jgi:cytochrome d ubiquinol oxidase subunit I
MVHLVLLGGAPQLLPARIQMAFTLGIHIILVPFGVAFPAIALLANDRGLRKGDPEALRLARRWSKAMAVLFAVGAVTGTVLSFEMGLLWPGLMGRFGGVFGLPFAVEGIFFFAEAIFIAIYIYGWERLSPRAHLWSGVPIVLSGIGGSASVIAANAWMNTPQGFRLASDGSVVDVHPLDAFFTPAFGYEFAHMLLAAYMIAGFMVASVYAMGMLRGRRDRYHRLGFLIPFVVAAIATPLQIVAGDFAARGIYQDQPIKFAAQELVTRTSTHVPETLGGVLIDGEVRYGIKIPSLASILAGFGPGTRITGLESAPRIDRPPANLVHLAFDVMVAVGFLLLGLVAWLALSWWRRRDLPRSRWFLRAATLAGAASVLALEAGWIVTEVGRQPWIVYGVMRTSEAVTTSPAIWGSFTVVVAVYAALAITAVLVLRGMSARWQRDEADEAGLPYGPRLRFGPEGLTDDTGGRP